MKQFFQTLCQKPWGIPAALAALLTLGLVLGIGVGHLVKRSHHPVPAVPVAAEPPPPAVAALPEPSVELPPLHMEDDSNGPAEVTPAPKPEEISPPAVKPESAAPPTVAVATPPPPVAVKPAGGKPAWLRFAVPSSVAADRPQIVVVIDDMGLDKRRSKRAIDLPPPMTLSFMTYAEDLAAQTAAAHDHGHELLVHMPMQAMAAHFNAGPNVLDVGLPDDELHHRIQWGLARFTGYVGVNNHMGSRFTADPAGMRIVMQEMKQHGLLFLDSVTTESSAAPEAARKQGVPFAQRQVFLDNEQTQDSIRQQLARTEAIARKHGQAIAIGHPHDATLSALAEWLPTLEAKGFSVVPLTTLVKEQNK